MAIWLQVISDLFVNLAAGWFGAATILPIVTAKSKFRMWALIFDIGAGIVALLIAVILRSWV